MLVEGVWRDQWYDTEKTGGRFEREPTTFCNWVTPDGPAGSHRRRRLSGRARPLPPLRVVRVPVGAPHADLPRAARARGHHRRVGRPRAHGRARLDVRARARRRRPAVRLAVPARALHARRAALHGPRHGARPLGPRARDDRLQRLGEDHPHAELGVRRRRRARARLLARGAARGDRRHQRRRLRPRQQRRLQGRLRDEAGAVRRSGARALRDARRARRPGLGRQPWLVGERQAEADWRLFTTLLRFDAVYHGHFKCNVRRLVDYPNLWPYARSLYQTPGVAPTVHWDPIKRHDYAATRR